MVSQFKDYADGRLIVGCIYCGGSADTREHVPSRIFLDRPFPENLPVVPACRSCNLSFSSDEEYLACLIECVLEGTTDPNSIERSRISRTLMESPALRARIERGKTETDGKVVFAVEQARVYRIVLKLARGHAAFELSVPVRDDPMSLFALPMAALDRQMLASFEEAPRPELWGEVGSRASQRTEFIGMTLLGLDGLPRNLALPLTDWVFVQDGSYRYLAIHGPEAVTVRIVIREYLACEVSWSY